MNKYKIIWQIVIITAIVIVGITAAVFVIHNRDYNEKTEKTVSINNHYSYAEEKSAPHNLLITVENEGYGLIDTEGNRVAAPEYDMLLLADYGLYYYKEGTQSGFLNGEARKVFTTEEVIGTTVSEDFVIYTRDGKNGFINIKNGSKIEACYEAVYDFSEGLAAVCLNDKIGFINSLGEMVIENKYYSKGLYYFTEGICSVIEGDPDVSASSYYINTNGDMVLNIEGSFGMQFYEGRAFVKEGDRWFLIDKNGERVTDTAFGPYESKMPGRFKDGYATVAVDGKYGVISRDGSFVINPTYDELGEMLDDKIVFKKDGKYGYMQKNGYVIISPVYDVMTGFKRDMSITRVDGKYGVITSRGVVVLENEYQKTEILDNGIIKTWTDDKTYFYMRSNGTVLWNGNSPSPKA